MTALEEKLTRYTKPSSDTEQIKQDRAERMLKDAVNKWDGFKDIRISFMVKGSYRNNTNVRADSDVDVAIIHEGFHYFDDSLLRPEHKVSGNVSIKHFSAVAFRNELERALESAFGSDLDKSGKTALTVAPNNGRVATDAVPSFRYVLYYYGSDGNIQELRGTKVYRKDGTSLINYPEQQLANGIAKNNRTDYRYKQVVRVLKRIENDLVAKGQLNALPSYFMECLVFPIADSFFVPPASSTTPLTDITRSVFLAIFSACHDKSANTWFEPNGVKPLFASSQPWTLEQGRVLAAMAYNLINTGTL